MIYKYPNSTVSGVGIEYPLVSQRRRDRRSPLSRRPDRWLGLLADPDDIQQLRRQPGSAHLLLGRRQPQYHARDVRPRGEQHTRDRWRRKLPPVTIAGITDGTSNTIMYGEHAHTQDLAETGDDYFGINWWTSGDYGDTTFSSIFPPNYFQTFQQSGSPPDVPGGTGPPQMQCRQDNWSMDSTSMHPGGCNFAFADGSVRFIKNSIQSWNPLNIMLTTGRYNSQRPDFWRLPGPLHPQRRRGHQLRLVLMSST